MAHLCIHQTQGITDCGLSRLGIMSGGRTWYPPHAYVEQWGRTITGLSLNGGSESADDRLHRFRHHAECKFYYQGTEYDPEWDSSIATWNSLAGWPLPERGADFISVRDNLRAAFTADVDLWFFGWAQMEEPKSMRNALTRNPGIYYQADGQTVGRPAMQPFRQTCAEGRGTGQTPHQWLNKMTIVDSYNINCGGDPEGWWHLPHPLQVIDSRTALTWNLLGACDIFEAAAGAPAGSFIERTERVARVTRDGVLISHVPDNPSHTGTSNPPCVAYTCVFGRACRVTETSIGRSGHTMGSANCPPK